MNAKIDLERIYEIDHRPVGSGAFGKVYKARSKTDADTLFAIKKMIISDFSPKQVELISQEVNVLNNLDHPNIVKYYEIYQDKESLYIVMED